jgi:hypothetical protein
LPLQTLASWIWRCLSSFIFGSNATEMDGS